MKKDNEMKLHLSRELKTGLIVLLIAIAMYWLVHFLKGTDIFSHFTSYQINYENVEGLTATGPVYIRGLKVGTIKSIVYNQQKDYFEVTVKLESKFQIPDNSIAQIYSVDLLGTKALRINLGNSAQMLAGGGVLQSDIAVDLLGYIAQELPSLKEQIAVVLTKLDTSVSNLNKILGAENQANLESSLAHLTETLSHFRSLASYLNTETPQIRSILANLNQLAAELGASAPDLKRTLSNLSDFSDTLKQADISGVIEDFNLLINRLQDPSGSLGKLMYTDDLHQNLTRLLHNLDSLVSNISQNPKKYLKISVF